MEKAACCVLPAAGTSLADEAMETSVPASTRVKSLSELGLLYRTLVFWGSSDSELSTCMGTKDGV